MASYVLRVISLTLGVFFIFIGTLKLTPSVNKELHKEMVRTDSVLFVSCTNVLLKLNCTVTFERKKNLKIYYVQVYAMHYLESMNENPTVLCQKLWMMMILMMNVLPRSNWLIHLIKIVLLKNLIYFVI